MAVLASAASATGQAFRLSTHPVGWTATDWWVDLACEDGLTLAAMACVLVPFATFGLSIRWTAGVGALLAAAAVATVDVRKSQAEPGPGEGRTLLLLSLDTLRADHVSSWPNEVAAGLTPHLDGLAERGTAYVDARAPAPLTLPVHATWLTGLTPQEHGALHNGRVVPASAPTVTEALSKAGWHTGAFVAADVLGAQTGLTRGFHVYGDALGDHPARRHLPLSRQLFDLGPARVDPGGRVVERALRWLDGREAGDDVFLWVHLYDAHAPRRVDPRRPAPAGALPSPCAYSDHPTAGRLGSGNPLRPLPAPLPPTERCDVSMDDAAAKYASAVRQLDAVVGELLAGVDARRADVRAVVAADHGESLTEHQHLGTHQWSTYEPTAHVPMWVIGPGYAPGVSTEPVSTASVAHHVRRLAELPSRTGAPAARATWGPAPMARGAAPGPGVQVHVREGALTALVDSRGHVERYDLAADPHQQRPLATAAEVAACRARLDAAEREPSRGWMAHLPTVHEGDPWPSLRQAHVCGHVADDVSAWTALEAAARRALEMTPLDGDVGGLEALGYVE